MAQINWSKLALNDLEKVYDFIAKDSSYYAQKTVEKIFERVLVLNDFPGSGRIVPEFNIENLRELIEGNYRIVIVLIEIK